MKVKLLCASLLVFLTFLTLPTETQAQLSQYSAVLTGDEEVPPVETDGFGVSFFTFHTVFNFEFLVTVRLTFPGLSGPAVAAHIHNAVEGVNGPIVLDYSNGALVSAGFLNININNEGDLEGTLEGQTLGDLRDLIESGDAYINVHTDLHPTGEIRGQIQIND